MDVMNDVVVVWKNSLRRKIFKLKRYHFTLGQAMFLFLTPLAFFSPTSSDGHGNEAAKCCDGHFFVSFNPFRVSFSAKPS
ncbi:hypothetical protein OIU84_028014 [Salix udensis]|uniref:Transmembrane protein n=1 Tax=Salix udensis TaxID=889485 RepID=A0AAD6P8H8_9ROSI|nr:hypothetical protein OIU84_028014 [Salix udensis]